MHRTLLAVSFFLAGVPALAQLPEMYKSVDRLVWVVKDLDPVVAGWEKLGFSPTQRFYDVEFAGEYRGKPATVYANVAIGRIGDLEVNWFQPVGGENAYTEFLARHGDGVLSLVHRAPTLDALNSEVDRLRGLGVGVLQRGTVEGPSGPITLVHLDTAAEGKYSLGLIHSAGEIPSAAAPANGWRRPTQYAFIARDTRAVSAFWSKLGFPEMSFTHGPLRNLQYRGKPGDFDQELGWQRHGKVVYEWIRPLKGPNVYDEHLKAHGEGFHHLAFNVEDMDKAIAEWTKAGYVLSQAGAWGQEGKPGSGRFAYLDTEAIGGVSVELLWSHK